jgi:hypothetical protein
MRIGEVIRIVIGQPKVIPVKLDPLPRREPQGIPVELPQREPAIIEPAKKEESR